MTAEAVNLMDPDFTKNPARGYGLLREQAPVVPVLYPGLATPLWLITRYEDVKAALTDPRFVMDRNNVPGVEGPSAMDQMMDALGVPDEYRDYLNGMLTMDGKQHHRLRSLVAPAFTARRMEAMRDKVEKIAHDLTQQLKQHKEADLIEHFAVPLAGTIICELIGVDEDDRAEVSHWIHNYSNSDPTKILQSAHFLVSYTKKLIERRRATPVDDLISKLVNTVDDNGDRLTEAEIIAMVILLIHTGHHATSHFIPSAALALLDHPEELARLRAEPSLLPSATNELLRVASPVTLGATMYATEDMEYRGVQIQRGDTLTVCLASANHDPRVFDEPERFDITRDLTSAENQNHVTFSHGPHYCVAAVLARLESEVAIDHLFLKLDGLSLAVDRDKVEYHPHPSGSLLVRLPVRLDS